MIDAKKALYAAVGAPMVTVKRAGDQLKELSDKLTDRFGEVSDKLTDDARKEFDLWADTLPNLCKEGCNTKVAEAMYTPAEDEFVGEDDNLENGIHRYIMSAHQPLIVRSNGVLSLMGIICQGSWLMTWLKPSNPIGRMPNMNQA